MTRRTGPREIAALVIVIGAVGILFLGIVQLRERDYLACIVLMLTGLPLAHLGAELTRDIRP